MPDNRALTDQLRELYALANRHGLYQPPRALRCGGFCAERVRANRAA